MRRLKIFLVIVLAVHLISNIRYNILGLRALQSESAQVNRLNRFGRVVIYNDKLQLFDNAVTRCLNPYAVFTGTNRGYEFFSPNISPVKIDLSFYSGGKEIELPLKTGESRNKLIAASYYLTKNIREQKTRDDVLKSISARLFMLNPSIDTIDVYINVLQFAYLNAIRAGDDYTKNYKIKAFTVTRNNNERL